MNILFVLVPLSLAIVLIAGWAFFWAVGAGQFDDLDSSGWAALIDDSISMERANQEHDSDD
jgi:cbb3-type cytochrome oxidase maturation protein